MTEIVERDIPHTPEVEDPPALSAEAHQAGTTMTDIYREQTEEVRRELLIPLVNTITGSEVYATGVTSDQAIELAKAMEQNALELREYAAKLKKLEDAPEVHSRADYDDY